MECTHVSVISYMIWYENNVSGLEEQLQQAKLHAEQFKSMSEANESALGDLNKVSLISASPVHVWNDETARGYPQLPSTLTYSGHPLYRHPGQ